MFDDLYRAPGFWSESGPHSDIVLSTRVRLARNLATVGFPHRQDASETSLINSIAARFVVESAYRDSYVCINLAELGDDDRRFLRERNIITSEMETSSISSVIFNSSDDIVIMVNEEDHFRIQAIKSGFQLMETYRAADKMDDELNKFVTYAFTDEFGYLTACPSNLGTGLRVSVMVHLPILSLMRSIPDVVRVVNDLGAEMRGAGGEVNKTVGSMYLVTNHVSLGKSEVDIIEELDEVASMIIEMEGDARDDYINQNPRTLEDRIWRSYGVMLNSRIISYAESMEQLSNIRMGVILSIIKNVDLPKINDLMVKVQWSHLQKDAGLVFSGTDECDAYRADFLRSQFN